MRLPVVTALAATLFIAACADGGMRRAGPIYAPGPYEQEPLPRVVGVLDGSVFDRRLGPVEREELELATLEALEAEAEKETVTWSMTGSADGTVAAGPRFLKNVENTRGGPLAAPHGIYTDLVLQPAAGAFATNANANVRLGPGTEFERVETLPSGSTVRAVGRTEGGDWIMVSRRDRVLGYIYAPLLDEQGGSDLLLAGGRPREPELCRLFKQSVSLASGDQDSWRGVACRRENGDWVVEPEPSV